MNLADDGNGNDDDDDDSDVNDGYIKTKKKHVVVRIWYRFLNNNKQQ